MSELLGLELNAICVSRATCYRLPTNNYPLPTIHLQWFADDDEDAPGKTEEPSEHKIQELRKEGQVVKSQELVGAIGLFIPALLLLFLAPSMLRTCVEMIRFFFERAVELDPTKDAVILAVLLRYFAKLAWPVLTVAFLSAIISNVIQVGFLFTTRPITPDFSKALPKIGQYFRRIFSVDGIYNFIKSIAKMLIIGFVAFILIYSETEKLLRLQDTSVWKGLTTVSEIAIKMLLISAILLVALSIPDLMFQRWRFRERNRMTKQEVKEEYKLYNGDPHIQARIRSRFRELLRQNIAVSVPKADVVVTNPTHLAVAIQYDKGMEGPMIVAMGEDGVAARIRQIAEKHEVPLVENKPLAWALYRDPNIDVGDIIPQEYWSTVALVLSKVWYLNEEKRHRRISA